MRAKTKAEKTPVSTLRDINLALKHKPRVTDGSVYMAIVRGQPFAILRRREALIKAAVTGRSEK